MKKGIEYQLTNEYSRGVLHSYHGKPNPLMLNKSPYKADADSIKPKDRQYSLVKLDRDFESKFTIGFEVEKNSFHSSALKEYELFCGFERDGSCGVEAVTHVLPLLPQSQWRTKVFDMMHKANRIIDDSYSPSDNRCGGHINIGVKGLNGSQILVKVRNFSGLIYALFPKRLQNYYCSYNKRMRTADEYYEGNTSDWHSKYQVCLVKNFGHGHGIVEFRIPNKVESVKQMMRRYELMYEVVNYSVNEVGSFNNLLKQVKPILMSMYNNDEAKVKEKMALAIDFQSFINTGQVSDAIRQYI